MIEHVDLAGRRCLTVLGSRAQILLLACCGPEPEAVLGEAQAFLVPDEAALVCVPSCDWDGDYTPWPSDELTGRCFTGGAAAFYRNTLCPVYEDACRCFASVRCAGVMGYSLGGLFALYAAAQPDSPFDRVGSVSGALWYEGLTDFVKAASFPALKQAYLSLGRQEARRGRGPMARVGAATAQAASALEGRLGAENVCFEWNNGGHFFEIPQRISRAVNWLCKL